MNETPFWRRLLGPLALLYGLGMNVRTRLYSEGVLPRRRLNGVVISIGNLTVGGTGKTPFAIWLAQRLRADGKRVGILTRGYRPAAGMSDEVAVLRSHLGDTFPIGIGADRYATGTELQKQGVTWFVLDDGFQLLRLARDVDIVLVDATEPLGRWRRLLPTGRLREPFSALRRADFVVITRAREAPTVAAVVAQSTSAPFFYAQTVLEGLHEIASGHAVKESEWRTRKWFAFSAIGNPGAFLVDLTRWGFDVVDHVSFRDHHPYTPRDLADLTLRARRAGAEALVCTEKDAVKVQQFRAGELPVYSCAISMVVAEEEKFWNALLDLARRRRGDAAG